MSADAACPCCDGSGRVCAFRRFVTVREALAEGAICAAEDTVYGNRRTGRWPWLTRVGPSGRKGRDLWIVVDQAVQWWLEQGRPKDAERILVLARRQGR